MRLKLAAILTALTIYCGASAEAGYYVIKLGQSKSFLVALQDFQKTEAGKNFDLGWLAKVRRDNGFSIKEARKLPAGCKIYVSDRLTGLPPKKPSPKDRAESEKLELELASMKITNEGGGVRLQGEEPTESVIPETGPVISEALDKRFEDMENRLDGRLNVLEKDMKELKVPRTAPPAIAKQPGYISAEPPKNPWKFVAMALSWRIWKWIILGLVLLALIGIGAILVSGVRNNNKLREPRTFDDETEI